MSAEPVWLHYPLQTLHAGDETRVFHLLLRNQVLESVTFYLFDVDGQLRAAESAGTAETASWLRPPLDRLSVALELAGDRRYSLLVRVDSRTPLALGLEIMDEQARVEQRQSQLALYWAALSVLLAATLFSAVILMAHRGKTYGWLLGFHLQALLYFSVLTGYGHLVYSDALFYGLSQSIMTLNFLFLFILYRFALSFLSPARLPDQRYHLDSWISGSLVVLGLLSIPAGDAISMPFFGLAIFLTVGLVLNRVLQAIRRGYWPAFILLLAMTVQAAGGIIGSLAYLNTLPVNLFTLNAYLVSTLFALGVLSFSVASRLRYIERNQRLLALRDEFTGYPNQAYASEIISGLWQQLLNTHGQATLIMVKITSLEDILSMLGPRATEEVGKALLHQFDPLLRDSGVALELPDTGGCHLCMINRDEAIFILSPTGESAFDPEWLRRYGRSRTLYQGTSLLVSARFALYRCREGGETLEQALRKLNIALVATRDQSPTLIEYSRSMDHRFQRRNWLTTELQKALEHESLDFAIHPQ